MEINGREIKGLLESNSIKVEDRVWKGIGQSLKTVESVQDKYFVIPRSRVDGDQFEDATDFLALAWRLYGSGQNNEEFDLGKFEKIISENHKLRFYLAYKALGGVYETEKELIDQGMIFNKVDKQWTNDLCNMLMDEVDNLGGMSELDVEDRLFIYADLAARSLHNLDLIDIDKISKDSPDYSSRAVGESYLTLEQIEKILQALLVKLEEENIPLSASTENYRQTIVGYINKLSERREKNADLVSSFFAKKERPPEATA